MPYSGSKKRFAKKSLGQNFLVDEVVVARIITALNPSSADVVLEIGPGRGALTEKLISRVGHLYALEFDRDLVPVLRDRFGDAGNFTVIEDDALKFDLRSLPKPVRLVANLPYNISTAILQRLFDVPDVFSDCLLMFQREVVERITAQLGTSDRGYLSVLTEAHFDVERVFDVPPTAFRPVPKVWSAVARLIPKQSAIADESLFRSLVSASFAQKRKTILNNLKARYPSAERSLSEAGIDPKRRAETLSLDEWTRLTHLFLAKRP